jgi:PII-like signaling protein
LKKSRAEFDKRLGELGGTWGKFVAEMVKPKIIDLFREKGIPIRTSLQNVAGFMGDDQYYEIDLLLINADIAVVVEIKSSLSVQDVKEHLERLDKISKIQPERINLSGVKLYGAVAGMIVENEADRFAYKKGLFVLRQKGNIVEIMNDSKFVPKEWKVEY